MEVRMCPIQKAPVGKTATGT
ncbi:MAG: hypothetical protein BAJATHORv1_10108 [Candidatus Thorarchaeota archaeon]|nr:MAG: hypothetical protein BAJATHORv1_10108 [Candidatus Thorarchaeota archaeon]